MNTEVRVSEDVFEAVREMIDSILVNERVIEPGSNLIQDLQMDSIYMVEFVIALEVHYNFKMTPEQLARLSTVGDVVTVIMDVQNQASGQAGQ